MIKPLTHYANEQLQLVQPSLWKRVYEFRTPDTVLYTMSYPKLFSSLSIVEGFGETWEVYKPKWWSRTMEIRKTGTEMPFAKFIGKSFGGGGVFELPVGERVHYRMKFWNGSDELWDEQGRRLVLFKKNVSFKSKITVTIENQSALLDKYPWMVIVVYRVILERRSQAGH